MKPFNFEKVKNTSDISERKGGQFIAGGTNLVDLMKKNIAQPDSLLDVTSALSRTITLQNEGLKIGAMVSNTQLATDAIVVSRFPLVAKAVLAGASPQIRNMASVAGNLMQRTRCPYFYDISTPCNKRQATSGCGALNGSQRMSAIVGHSNECVAVHPSDMCVALAALEAKVVVQNQNGDVSTILFKDFHKLPENTPWLDNTLTEGALITRIDIPENAFNKHVSYLKIRDRTSYAFALVSVAAALNIENGVIIEARLASGGVAHKPWRWYEVENFLKGKRPDAAVFSDSAEIALKDLKPLSGNSFKVPMLKGAIETALQNCLNA